MVAVNQLHYMVLGVKDLAAWEEFATKGVGLVVSRRQGDTVHYRGDRDVARIITVQSDHEDVQAIGWSVSAEADLDELIAQLVSEGIEYSDVRGQDARTRNAIRLVRIMFDGVVHEVAWGLAFEDRIPFQSPVAIEGFRLGELGLGHIAMLVSDMEQSDRFITQILGHKVTGHMFVGPTEVRFYRCSARHHSIGIVQDPSPPRRVQHIQIEYNSMDDLGRALDRAAQLPMPVIVPIGKHNADWVISFYVRSPSGVAIELAHGGRLMREDEPTELEIFSGSVWGHRTGMDKL